jgi:hypothetical protein
LVEKITRSTEQARRGRAYVRRTGSAESPSPPSKRAVDLSGAYE